MLAVCILLMCLPPVAQAQKWAVSTNVLTWANMGTINAECAASVHRHISLNAGFTANPWEMSTPTDVKIMNKQYGGYFGAKIWPWHTFSEWWIGAKVQYKNFEQVGLLSSNLMSGDALGAGLSAGYSLMIGGNFNLDFGLGFWGGRLLDYKKYKGTRKVDSEIADSGARNFFFLDNIMLSLVYIF